MNFHDLLNSIKAPRTLVTGHTNGICNLLRIVAPRQLHEQINHVMLLLSKMRELEFKYDTLPSFAVDKYDHFCADVNRILSLNTKLIGQEQKQIPNITESNRERLQDLWSDSEAIITRVIKFSRLERSSGVRVTTVNALAQGRFNPGYFIVVPPQIYQFCKYRHVALGLSPTLSAVRLVEIRGVSDIDVMKYYQIVRNWPTLVEIHNRLEAFNRARDMSL